MKKIVIFLLLMANFVVGEDLKRDKWQNDIPLKAIEFENSAIIHLQMNIIDRAIGYFHKALREKPNYYLALYNLALAYYAKGDLDSTYKILEKAYGIAKKDDIKDVMIYSLFGYANMLKGNENRSMSIYEEGMKIQASSKKRGLLFNNYALLEFRKGNYAKARELFEKAGELGNTKSIQNLEMINKIQTRTKK